jgi:cell fate regulator YaaT (PSP1 superfamily)
MPDDSRDFPEWIPSDQELKELEDNDFELYVEDVYMAPGSQYHGPCEGCTCCATGTNALGDEFENEEASLDIVEVEFKLNRTGFYLNDSALSLQLGSRVIVEAEIGFDLGEVILLGERVHQKRRSCGMVGQPIRRITRRATMDDLNREIENRQDETDAVSVFKGMCKKHSLELKLSGVEYQFDRSRITFFFAAPHRIDFRSLVRDLAGVYQTRIELRQIGARDQAKKVGAVGICGREVCCIAWMDQIKRVISDYARIQGITLNPRRLSGSCGKIKCCVLFEMQSYLEARTKFQASGSTDIIRKEYGVIDSLDA